MAVQNTNYLQDGIAAAYIRDLDENGDPTGNFLELRGINAADLQRQTTEREVPAKNTRLRKDSKTVAYEGDVTMGCMRADMLEYFLPGELVVAGNKVTFSEKVNKQPKKFALYLISDAIGVNDEAGAIGELYRNCTATNFQNAKSNAEYVSFVASISAEPKDGIDARELIFDADSLPFNVTNDTTAPTVSSTTPTNGATGVAVSAAPTVAFSESMKESSLNGIKLVTKSTGIPVSATISYAETAGPAYTATVTPAADLAASTEYMLLIPSTVRDANGVYKAADQFVEFETA